MLNHSRKRSVVWTNLCYPVSAGKFICLSLHLRLPITPLVTSEHPSGNFKLLSPFINGIYDMMTFYANMFYG
jgi:hypothetical protein